jgi:hypothetical protein
VTEQGKDTDLSDADEPTSLETWTSPVGIELNRRMAELEAMPGFQLKLDLEALGRAGHVMYRNTGSSLGHPMGAGGINGAVSVSSRSRLRKVSDARSSAPSTREAIGRLTTLDQSKADLARRMHASGGRVSLIGQTLASPRATVYRVLAESEGER